MVQQIEIRLPALGRGFHIITDRINGVLADLSLPETGLLNLFILHTSAGLCINENADPTVLQDFETFFNKLAPENIPHLKHDIEGPDDMPAHIKSTLTGHSLMIPIKNRRLYLGTWQGVYLCEFRNAPHFRRLVLTIYS